MLHWQWLISWYESDLIWFDLFIYIFLKFWNQDVVNIIVVWVYDSDGWEGKLTVYLTYGLGNCTSIVIF